ncbi:hypothetical protein RKE38_03880 [Phycicoccus sp. M110.8]|uniref:hypothetical protein n=1 Tax=Phycicoccus sp. M110.8 TaxID=3075433 RepID=UPI0028FDB1D2|nr:hypothetical protein [Phycicoccus sp. M110.8]MDU0312814.1 hypothetical protein [Phycicoccus sp. M110.8]
MDERPSRVGAADTGLVSRRTVNLGAAWSVPVVLAAVAAPADVGSQTPANDRTALAAVWGEKGEADGPNRQVWFTFSFSGVTGTNTIQIQDITQGPWITLPTEVQSFSATSGTTATVTFMLERPDNNAAMTVDVTYVLNGAVKTAVGVVIKNKVVAPKKP